MKSWWFGDDIRLKVYHPTTFNEVLMLLIFMVETPFGDTYEKAWGLDITILGFGLTFMWWVRE